MLNSIAICILSIVIATGIFFDYKKKLSIKWKIFFVVIITLGNIALLVQSKEKDKIEQHRWNNAQFNEDLRTREMSNAFRENKEEAKTSLTNDFQETPTLFLDRNYSRLKNLLQGDKVYYLTIYFSVVNKIPNFYNLEEWKETENILFNQLYNRLRSDYSVRKTNFELIKKEFTNERLKYLRAKERQYKL